MQKVKIETLTPVHIGSGRILRYGPDFVKGTLRIDGESALALGIVDAKKVLSIVGEKNIDKWVTAIERKESTLDFVHGFNKSITVHDVALRELLLWDDSVNNTDTLREQLYDGYMQPYIPGSSIKGAIRTAVLSQKIKERADLLNDFRHAEKRLFGKTPQDDVFRFLRIGDAYFGNVFENNLVVRMESLNIRDTKGLWDTTKTQLVEVIGPEDESSFAISIDFANMNRNAQEISSLRSYESLFKTINEHTKQLLVEEVNRWKEYATQAIDGSDKVELYIEAVNNILKEVHNCREGQSCILRIGYGSGWRFITGAWTEDLDSSVWNGQVVKESRPNNELRYQGYVFPKTRRIGNIYSDETNLLGFVKLSL